MTEEELYHFGIKGMKWGVRRYQNKDGSLTPEGKKHVSAYRKNLQQNKDVDAEAKKLFSQDKRLKKDFGGPNQIDDAAFFEMVARDYGLNTDNYWSKVVDRRTFYNENRKSIDKGRNLVNKILAEDGGKGLYKDTRTQLYRQMITRPEDVDYVLNNH